MLSRVHACTSSCSHWLNTVKPSKLLACLLIHFIHFCRMCRLRNLKGCWASASFFFFIQSSFFSSKPADGNDRLDMPNSCQDNGNWRVTENPWQSKHEAAIQTAAVFGPGPPLTGVICCVNLQLGSVWLLSGFRALGQKRQTPCPLTKGLALIEADKACWWSLFKQLNLVNES